MCDSGLDLGSGKQRDVLVFRNQTEVKGKRISCLLLTFNQFRGNMVCVFDKCEMLTSKKSG